MAKSKIAGLGKALIILGGGAIAAIALGGGVSATPKPPKVCPPGQKLNPQSNECEDIVCPPGTQLNLQTNECDPIICPPGHLLNLTTNQCDQIICDPGQKLNLNNNTCEDIICSPGQRLNLSNNQCEDIVCPPGTQLNLNTNNCDPIICPPGHVINLQTNTCDQIQCPAGHILNLTTGNCDPVVCPGGTQLNLNNNQCEPIPCPPDKIIDPNTNTCICPTGTKLDPSGTCIIPIPVELNLINTNVYPDIVLLDASGGLVDVDATLKNISTTESGNVTISASIKALQSNTLVKNASVVRFFNPQKEMIVGFSLSGLSIVGTEEDYFVEWEADGKKLGNSLPFKIRKFSVPPELELVEIPSVHGSEIVEGQTLNFGVKFRNVSGTDSGNFPIKFILINANNQIILETQEQNHTFSPEETKIVDASFQNMPGVSTTTLFRIDSVINGVRRFGGWSVFVLPRPGLILDPTRPLCCVASPNNKFFVGDTLDVNAAVINNTQTPGVFTLSWRIINAKTSNVVRERVISGFSVNPGEIKWVGSPNFTNLQKDNTGTVSYKIELVWGSDVLDSQPIIIQIGPKFTLTGHSLRPSDVFDFNLGGSLFTAILNYKNDGDQCWSFSGGLRFKTTLFDADTGRVLKVFEEVVNVCGTEPNFSGVYSKNFEMLTLFNQGVFDG